MKTSQEVARQFGLDYEPVRRYPWKRKLRLSHLTPSVRETRRFFRQLAFWLGIVFLFYLLMLGLGAYIAS